MKWLVTASLIGGIVVIWIPYPVELVRLGMSAVMLGAAILYLIESTTSE